MVNMAAVSKPNLDEGRRGGLSPRPKARGPYTFLDTSGPISEGISRTKGAGSDMKMDGRKCQGHIVS